MSQLPIQQALQTAMQHHQAGQLPQAEALYRQILAAQPNHAEALHYLGVIAAQAGRHDVAVELIGQAIALQPNNPEAYSNCGEALRVQGRPDEAIAACRKAIALNSDLSDAYNNLGNALKDKGELDEALAAFRQAIALNSNFAEAHGNLGNVLKDKGQLDEAIVAYRQAIALRPDLAEVHCNLGSALQDKGQFKEAVAACRQAIALKPSYPESHGSLALALLTRGEFIPGWDEYEWRWRCKDFALFRRNFPQPQWDGSDLSGHTILLHTEQGFGDALQFIRYLPLVTQRGGRIIIQCQAELQRLFQIMAGDCPVMARGQPLPAFDVHCPLLSLPRVFGTTLGTIPRQVPYLHAAHAMVENWRERLAVDAGSLNVGLAWAGHPAFKGDRLRSPRHLSLLAPLVKIRKARFVSLQKGEASNQTRNPPEGMNLVDWTEELKDFADTAALIANLDLVISSDTAVVHLAGAMGKPVWVLLPFAPDWRWLLEREDSPWYPTMRLFRQPAIGDWDSVMQKVVDALAKLSLR